MKRDQFAAGAQAGRIPVLCLLRKRQLLPKPSQKEEVRAAVIKKKKKKKRGKQHKQNKASLEILEINMWNSNPERQGCSRAQLCPAPEHDINQCRAAHSADHSAHWFRVSYSNFFSPPVSILGNKHRLGEEKELLNGPKSV